MDRANQDELHETLTKSRNRRCDDRDPPPPPPPKDSDKTSQSHLFADDIPTSDEVNILDLEDADVAHLPKIRTPNTWLRPLPEEDRPKTPEPNWSVPLNDLPETENDWENALAKSYKDPKENKLLQKTGDMGSFIKWLCKRIGKKKLSKSNSKGPTFNCHRLLTDQVDLVNPEGHRIVPDVSKPLPLGGPLEDYTIISKPRAIIYRDRNDIKKMMRIQEVYKFSDGTLSRVLDKLDHIVKDFKLFEYNRGMENSIWSKDDKRRSEEFIEMIERRLKIRRIFKSLETFVGRRLRDVDYRLINRT
ncbi:hypothetical protein Tco_0232826 [Tanacetum coccineum]